MEPLSFSTSFKSRPVVIDGQEYQIKEMMAAARDRYMDSLKDRMVWNNEGRVIGMQRYDGMTTDLLALTLYTKEGKLVDPQVIKAWPASVVSALFKEAQAINQIQQSGKEIGETAKNVLAGSGSSGSE